MFQPPPDKLDAFLWVNDAVTLTVTPTDAK
jgi:hypothetical protein